MKSKKPLTYLITEGLLTSQNYPEKSRQLFELIGLAFESNVSMIQIREKNLPLALLFHLTSEIIKLRKTFSTKILVNDRADLAFAANADGVHLTAYSIPTKIIRQTFPPNFIIGVSTHSSEKVLQAKKEGADFAVFSPIFETPNKGKPQGVEKLLEIVNKSDGFPLLALGGINEGNFRKTLKAGATGIAGIRLFSDPVKLPTILKKIYGEFDE